MKIKEETGSAVYHLSWMSQLNKKEQEKTEMIIILNNNVPPAAYFLWNYQDTTESVCLFLFVFFLLFFFFLQKSSSQELTDTIYITSAQTSSPVGVSNPTRQKNDTSDRLLFVPDI